MVIDAYGRLTDDGVLWIYQPVNAYRENCIAISILRGEDRAQEQLTGIAAPYAAGISAEFNDQAPARLRPTGFSNGRNG
jgi:hypothetical protein